MPEDEWEGSHMAKDNTNTLSTATTGELRSYPDRMRVFRENFAKWTDEQLLPYRTGWVAFSADGTRILAHAPDLYGVEAQLVAAAIDPEDVVFTTLPFADDADCGGVQFVCE